jgi:hypothetical protein
MCNRRTIVERVSANLPMLTNWIRTMKRKAILLSALLAAGLGVGNISAQPRGYQGWGMMEPGRGPGMMGRGWPGARGGMMGMGCPMLGFGDEDDSASFAEGRIAFIKAELGITDAQKSAWDGYVQALKTNLASMQAMHQQMRTLFEAKSPVERLDARIATMEGRLSALKEMKPALATLHETLDVKQREAADELLTVMGCMM